MHTSKALMPVKAILLATATLFCSTAFSATAPLTDVEQADLLFMREEEKLARDVYLTLYELWELSVFSNIASSEQMHMNALLKLLKKYSLDDPAEGNGIGEFSDDELQALYDTLIARGQMSGLEALKVGGIIEETDMRDIQEAIENSTKDAIDAVYESLLCGSRNHLRSFAENIEKLTGEAYVAQVLRQYEVDEILATPMEKCGSNAVSGDNPGRGKRLGWMK